MITFAAGFLGWAVFVFFVVKQKSASSLAKKRIQSSGKVTQSLGAPLTFGAGSMVVSAEPASSTLLTLPVSGPLGKWGQIPTTDKGLARRLGLSVVGT